MNTSTIRLLFIVNKLKRRGAEQQLFSFIKALPPQFGVTIFRFSNTSNEYPELFQYESVRIVSNDHAGTFNLFKFFPLIKHLKKNTYDAAITVGLGAALFIGRICAYASGISVVYSLLNTFENFHNLPRLAGQYFDILNKILNYLLVHQSGSVYRFFPNSEGLSAKLRPQLNGYPIHTLYNGLPSEDFDWVHHSTGVEQTNALLQKIDRRPVIVQVGALDDVKNHFFTLRCLKEIRKTVPQVCYLIIGSGDNSADYMHWIKRNDLVDNVIFAGQMNRLDCLYLISKSNLLVLTSKSESFPNVLMEAQALSTPVVSFDVGAASEIVAHGRTGYIVKKNDESAFISCVSKILDDEERASNMGDLGRQRVLQLFAMDIKIKRFVHFIQADIASTHV